MNSPTRNRIFFAYWILLPLVCVSNNLLGQAAEFDKLVESLNACYDSSQGNCSDLFQKCLDHLEKLSDHKEAGDHYLRLGNERMRQGRWDDLALQAFTKANERFALKGDECEMVNSKYALARYNRFQGIADSTLSMAKSTLNTALSCGDSSKIARSYAFMGTVFNDESNYKNALDQFQKAEQIYTHINDSLGMAGLLLDMAMVYSEMQEKTKSRAMTFRAAQIFKAAGEPLKYAIALNDYCADLLDTDFPDSALIFLPMAEEIIAGKHRRAHAYLEQNYGTAYHLKGEYNRSVEHYKKALELITPIGDKSLMIRLHLYISESLFKQEKYREAISYTLKADSISKSGPKNFIRSLALLSLAKNAQKVGDYDLSYSSFSDYISLSDSLLGDEKRKKIAALEQMFEAEKKEEEIRFQQAENLLLTEKNRAASNRNYALFASLLLAILLAYALYERQRIRIKSQEATVKLQHLENTRLVDELAHKNRELTSKALQIARNNELLKDLEDGVKAAMTKDSDNQLGALAGKLKFTQQQDKNWDEFTAQFNELNPNFYKSLSTQYENLSKSELRLASLLRMCLSSKDIAGILSITEDGVKKARYRLRKKMNLSSEESLEAKIMEL